MEINNIKNILKKIQSEKLYAHTESTCSFAFKLAGISKLSLFQEPQSSKNNFLHSLGVSPHILNEVNNPVIPADADCKFSMEKLELMSLLHDCAKEMTLEEIKDKCGIDIAVPAEEKERYFEHSYYSFLLSKYYFSITDDNILNSILFHTTASPELSNEGKILFISDYTEPSRNHIDNLFREKILNIIVESINKAVYYIIKSKLKYLIENDKYLFPFSILCYNYYNQLKE